MECTLTHLYAGAERCCQLIYRHGPHPHAQPDQLIEVEVMHVVFGELQQQLQLGVVCCVAQVVQEKRHIKRHTSVVETRFAGYQYSQHLIDKSI